MASFFDYFSLIGLFSVGVMMIVLARLSYRLGEVTRARAHYRWYYLAALCLWAGSISRAAYWAGLLASNGDLNQNIGYILLSDGLPALGATVGLLATWYYWSWLLAERD